MTGKVSALAVVAAMATSTATMVRARMSLLLRFVCRLINFMLTQNYFFTHRMNIEFINLFLRIKGLGFPTAFFDPQTDQRVAHILNFLLNLFRVSPILNRSTTTQLELFFL